MQMSGSMAIYSSSPPASIWSSQVTTAHPSSASTFEIDVHSRSQLLPTSNSKTAIRGGLSSLFSCPSSRVPVVEVMETSSLCSSPEDRMEGSESRSMGINVYASSLGKNRDRSPVSVLHGSLSHGSSVAKRYYSLMSREAVSSGSVLPPLDPCLGSSFRRSSPSAEGFWPVSRQEGFEATNAARCIITEVESDCWDVEISEDESSSNLESLPSSVGLCSSFDDGDQSDHGFVDEPLCSRFSFENEVMDTLKPCEVLESTESFPLCDVEEEYVRSILEDAQRRHKIFLDKFVIRAFNLANEAHRGQVRRNGDMYLVHCVETALLLATAGADSTVVAAGLLHDAMDDSDVDEQLLQRTLSDDVADLVIGVSKLSKFSQLARDNDIANNALEADRLRTMFLAMVDARVVLIKLADRLHNLRTLHALPKEKQQRLANETLEVFAPIANRLGIWRWKAEMEDLCFKYLNPKEHQELATRLAESCREGVVNSAVEKLDKALRSKGLEFNDLSGRSKSLFSIHRKMAKKGRGINEIYDLRGLRLIVPDKQSCYAALNAVHDLWNHFPEKLKDYIQLPKSNGYQSLHTIVEGEDGLPLEVQIRTLEMHRHAEFGMAAHWRYKEENSKHSAFMLQKVEWARWVLTWHSELMDSKLQLAPTDLDLRPPCPFPVHRSNCPHVISSFKPPQNDDDPLFIIMLKEDKMIVRELPPGSTAADLLVERRALSNGVSGGSEMRTIVNHTTVDIKQKLQTGDLVELVADSSRSVFDAKDSQYFSTSRGMTDDMDISVCRDQIRRMYEDSGKYKNKQKRMFQSQSYRDRSVTMSSVL